jgi:hypothetical protein
MFGSNCPPDTIFYNFKTLLRTYMEAFADYLPDEQEVIFTERRNEFTGCDLTQSERAGETNRRCSPPTRHKSR